jgi:hypothetical protein
MPVILATQEAEIRRIKIWSQHRETVYETLSQKYPTEKRAGFLVSVRLWVQIQDYPKKKEEGEKGG